MTIEVDRPDFLGAVLKVERAHHHIEQFKDILQAYIRKNVRAATPNPKSNYRKPRPIGGQVPRYTPAIVGDAIHNLRVSLDHAFCALVKANGGTVDRWTTFPFGLNKQQTEATVNGRRPETRPSAQVLRYIFEEAKPYEVDGSDLYGIHKLDIADKHTVLIGTDAETRFQNLTFVDRLGMPINNFSGINVVIPHDMPGLAAVGVANGGGAIVRNPNATFDLCFAEGQSFGGRSILKTLQHLAELTGDTVVALSKL